MSWHGFRAMASTLLNELSVPPDVIEPQLAHQSAMKCALLITGHSVSMNGAK
jgi:hypothetical protein